MSSNGQRKPPRPRIEMLGSPTQGEAAAVIAAVEQFIAETAPAVQPAERTNPWQRAALLEGTGGRQRFPSPWGEPRTWGTRRGVAG